MKSLVIFYSLEGHTKLVAQMIAKEIGAELLELKPEKEIPKSGVLKYFWGGKSVLFKSKPVLRNKMPNLEMYDTVLIGTPIWAGTYTPPVYSFLSDNKIQHKKVAFFACHAGGGAKKCFERLQKELVDNTLLGTIEFADPKEENKREVQQHIKKWVADTIKK